MMGLSKKKDETFTLAFYMRSGNVVRAHHVTGWTINYDDHRVSHVEIEWDLGTGNNDKGIGIGLILESLSLEQIEAVVREPS